jgi:fibronectin-binding autotransporter adhesin
LEGSVFFTNIEGISDGGAVQARSTSTIKISGCAFANHAAIRGAAISSEGIMDVSDSFLTSCTAGGNGGAIRVSNSSTVTVSNSAFAKNTASGGGAISAAGNLTVIGCQFDGNEALLPAPDAAQRPEPSGGAIAFIHQINNALPQLLVANSSFTNNTAAVRGGAIISKGGFTLVNCEFRNNSAAQYAGGALFALVDKAVAYPTVQPTVFNCTFVGTTVAKAAQGGGGAVSLDGFTLTPVIINEVSDHLIYM